MKTIESKFSLFPSSAERSCPNLVSVMTEAGTDTPGPSLSPTRATSNNLNVNHYKAASQKELTLHAPHCSLGVLFHKPAMVLFVLITLFRPSPPHFWQQKRKF